MRYAMRWWETLSRAERIVAMSLAAGGLVAMVNSTAWAIAVSYMARQKTLVALAAHSTPPRSVSSAPAIGDDQAGVEREALNRGQPAAPARLVSP